MHTVSSNSDNGVVRRWHWRSSFLLAVIVAYGALLRVSHLLDDPGFVHADATRHFQAAGEISLAEPSTWFAVKRGYLPFAIWSRLVFGLTFHHPIAQRLGTVLLSVLLIFLVAKAAEKRIGKWGGVFAGFLVAVSPPLIACSDSGIRTDLLSCLWIASFYTIFLWKCGRDREHVRWITAAVLLVLLFLTRVDTIVSIAVFVLFTFWNHRIWHNPRILVPGISIATLLLTAVLFANWYRYDDPLHFVDRQKNTLRYWANIEFHGQPGFPSSEEVEAFSRTGPPLSAWEYFGETLGWRETASRFYRGYRSFFLGNVSTGVYTFTGFPNQIGMVGLLTLGGIFLALWKREIVLVVLLPLLVVSTIWTYHIPEGHDFRFYLPVIPFATLLAADCAAWVWGRVTQLSHRFLRIAAQALLVILVLSNPWNHDSEISFPWVVGPVMGVPERVQCEPVEFGDHVALVGWELRKIGPLGLWTTRLDEIRAGRRFRVRLFWTCLIPAAVDGSYRVKLHQPGIGEFGSTQKHPITAKYPFRYWLKGQIVLDEFDYLIFPRVHPNPTDVILEIEGAGLPQGASSTLTTFDVTPIGWSLIDARDWG